MQKATCNEEYLEEEPICKTYTQKASLLRTYSSRASVMLVQRRNRKESPETDADLHGHLIYDNERLS